MEKVLKQAISPEAANEISKLMIDREHSVRMAIIWESSEPGDDLVNENHHWLYQCEAELKACKIEQTLLEDFGIKMREDWTSVTLQEEIKLLEGCVADAKRSGAA